MPPVNRPTKMTVWHWLVLAAIAAFGLWVLYAYSPLRWVLAGFSVLMVVGAYFGRRYFKRLEEERKEESICSFSRALPAKKHDTWVVRAVYEEVSRFVRVPIRPSDDLEKDLRMHPDDRDDLALEIARRAGRSMKDTQKNPLFDRVKTLADMVALFENQKREANQSVQRTSAAPPSLT
jgi:hypothetical protein